MSSRAEHVWAGVSRSNEAPPAGNAYLIGGVIVVRAGAARCCAVLAVLLAMEAAVEAVAEAVAEVAPKHNCSAVAGMTADWPVGAITSDERFLRGSRFLIQVLYSVHCTQASHHANICNAATSCNASIWYLVDICTVKIYKGF